MFLQRYIVFFVKELKEKDWEGQLGMDYDYSILNLEDKKTIDYYSNMEVTEEVYNSFTAEPSKYIWDADKQEVIENPNYEEEKVKEREEQFNKDFFNTSLGYVRRKVSMATGETKDFLSDLLPTISIGVQMGQPITIITYNKPDFTQEITDWTVFQNEQTVTAEFVQECFLQLSNDFKPVEDTSDQVSEQVNEKTDQVTDQVEEQDDNTTDTAE